MYRHLPLAVSPAARNGRGRDRGSARRWPAEQAKPVVRTERLPPNDQRPLTVAQHLLYEAFHRGTLGLAARQRARHRRQGQRVARAVQRGGRRAAPHVLRDMQRPNPPQKVLAALRPPGDFAAGPPPPALLVPVLAHERVLRLERLVVPLVVRALLPVAAALVLRLGVPLGASPEALPHAVILVLAHVDVVAVHAGDGHVAAVLRRRLHPGALQDGVCAGVVAQARQEDLAGGVVALPPRVRLLGKVVPPRPELDFAVAGVAPDAVDARHAEPALRQEVGARAGGRGASRGVAGGAARAEPLSLQPPRKCVAVSQASCSSEHQPVIHAAGGAAAHLGDGCQGWVKAGEVEASQAAAALQELAALGLGRLADAALKQEVLGPTAACHAGLVQHDIHAVTYAEHLLVQFHARQVLPLIAALRQTASFTLWAALCSSLGRQSLGRRAAGRGGRRWCCRRLTGGAGTR